MSIRYVHLNLGCYKCKSKKVKEVSLTKFANHMYTAKTYFLCDKHKDEISKCCVCNKIEENKNKVGDITDTYCEECWDKYLNDIYHIEGDK